MKAFANDKTHPMQLSIATVLFSLIMAVSLSGCASGGENQSSSETGLAPGSYEIEVDTDSSMFRAHACTLEVAEDGSMTAHLALPGEGFSRLYFGTDEEAASAPDDEIFDYYLGEDDKYTFDLPVSALDEDLVIAAYGQRRSRWYPHTIMFVSPAAESQAAA